MNLKNLYLIIGESGSGKSTIVKKICDKYQLTEIKSYTTRQPRYIGENTHIFINESKFNALSDIVAKTFFSGNYYCATQKQVDDADFYIIDKNGIEYFKEHYKGTRPYKIIYITAPFFARQQRMLSRGDCKHDTVKRLINDDKEFYGVRDMCDMAVVNIDICDTVNRVWEYIKSEEGA